MTPRLFHNPNCGTSRNALALLQERGVEPEVVLYAKVGWDAATLNRLAEATGGGLRGLLREREAGAQALLASDADDATILTAMLAEPLLVQRPILETDKGARIGRPKERMLEVL